MPLLGGPQGGNEDARSAREATGAGTAQSPPPPATPAERPAAEASSQRPALRGSGGPAASRRRLRPRWRRLRRKCRHETPLRVRPPPPPPGREAEPPRRWLRDGPRRDGEGRGGRGRGHRPPRRSPRPPRRPQRRAVAACSPAAPRPAEEALPSPRHRPRPPAGGPGRGGTCAGSPTRRGPDFQTASQRLPFTQARLAWSESQPDHRAIVPLGPEVGSLSIPGAEGEGLLCDQSSAPEVFTRTATMVMLEGSKSSGLGTFSVIF
ncbi:proline-rich protein 2-like isoform X2 [Falco peregrinus]|uniref:proline-rich protein 2-like isoform X2 n=1 Tax=Falco peregrinus TaxID=8954 RepID=UPI0024798F04|nr:proline-rich protein 2-like isoform X2 [Falco peregrinus]